MLGTSLNVILTTSFLSVLVIGALLRWSRPPNPEERIRRRVGRIFREGEAVSVNAIPRRHDTYTPDFLLTGPGGEDVLVEVKSNVFLPDVLELSRYAKDKDLPLLILSLNRAPEPVRRFAEEQGLEVRDGMRDVQDALDGRSETAATLRAGDALDQGRRARIQKVVRWPLSDLEQAVRRTLENHERGLNQDELPPNHDAREVIEGELQRVREAAGGDDEELRRGYATALVNYWYRAAKKDIPPDAARLLE